MIVGPAIGIQAAAAKIVVEGTVEIVGPRFHGHVHHAAQIVAEIGWGAAGDEIELLHSVWSRHVAHVIIVGLVIVHAVEKEIVLLLAGSIHVGASRSKAVLRRLEAEKVGRNHTWRRYQRQLVGVVG